MLAQFGKLFQREVEILQKLKEYSHPNIVRYYGFKRKNNLVYIFFELCEGNLMDKLEEGALQEDKLKSYFRDIMTGLAEIHSRDVIHRDLKPENILFDSQ
jgi:serine/threonine protein kinase